MYTKFSNFGMPYFLQNSKSVPYHQRLRAHPTPHQIAARTQVVILQDQRHPLICPKTHCIEGPYLKNQ